ncbi:hypothetical protein KP509_14G028400 [Ceratopteris richardii]|uniref:DFDF domain-containing protein n=1 Tax=Ceratopteris richardii TaxID=49495 RepID=A0A8T2T8G7_CERRI|nr:hypothetical protein KP509_14G028400 [Ceratopteris richardii]
MENLKGSCLDIYVGSLISLTSKSEIRYEGLLFTLDTEKSTIVLKDVCSFGTEGRGTNILQIPPSNKVYEYIIFRNVDIKDLSVISFPSNSEKPFETISERTSYEEKVFKSLNDGNFWQWFCSSAASSSYCIPPNALLTTYPNYSSTTMTLPFWRSSTQENYNSMCSQAKLLGLEQSPFTVRNCQSSTVTKCFSGHKSDCGGLTIDPGTDPVSGSAEGGEACFNNLQVQFISQQPLLPLPVPESEHNRLIMKSKGLASLQCARRQRSSRKGKPKGVLSARIASSVVCDEVCTSNVDVSKDFDFEAMNEHFNKKEIWDHLRLNEHHGTCIDGQKEGSSQTTSDANTTSCSLLKKACFIDDFFDMLQSDVDNGKEKMSKKSNLEKQHQIDSETFGVLSPLNKRRSRFCKKAFSSDQHVSISTK